MELFELKEIEERVILVGVQENNGDDTEESLHELEELASTAGAVTVGMLIQNREAVHPGTYIGKGKIEELRILAEELGATGIICDDELSPVQLRNLEQELDIKVMDRTLIILDIFAGRASTSEGKIQVELAQLKYELPRIFDRGFTGSNGRSRGGSTGMGLYLARRLAAALEIELRAASEEGKGTRMTLLFPARENLSKL